MAADPHDPARCRLLRHRIHRESTRGLVVVRVEAALGKSQHRAKGRVLSRRGDQIEDFESRVRPRTQPGGRTHDRPPKQECGGEEGGVLHNMNGLMLESELV